MKVKILLFLLPCLLLACLVWAHECWMMADKFHAPSKSKVTLSFHVGENFEGEVWKGNIISLVQYNAQKQPKSILPVLTDIDKRTVEVTLDSEGQHLIALQSADKFIELEADKFNAYLKEDGLKNVLTYRQQHAEIAKKGTELYQRCNKTLLQTTDNPDKNKKMYQKVVGTRLEIILLDNPYKNLPTLRAKVLFDGKPLRNHLVKYWNRHQNTTQKEEKITDKVGIVTFQLKQKEGVYMISTVNMVKNDKPEIAQWHSYWANFSFGYTK